MKLNNTKGLSRAATAIIVIVILAAGGIGAFTYLSSASPSAATSSTSTSTIVQTSTATTTAVQTSTKTTTVFQTQTSSSSSSVSKAPETLVIDDAQWPNADLNVLYSYAAVPWPNWLEYTVYQPIVTVNLAKEYQQGIIEYMPALARNWTVSPDGKTYTFNLRENVAFSNGDPFNAYDVWMQMYAFYYLTGNNSHWFQATYDFFDMSNVNFGPSTIALISQKGGVVNPSQEALNVMMNTSWPIYVTGPHQIVFHLKAAFPWFLGALVVMEADIFDVQYVLDHGGFGTPASVNTYFNQNAIPGTGPYVVAEVSQNSFVKFTQNPTYWGKSLTAEEIAANPALDPGHVKTVIVDNKADDVSRYTDLSNGNAQIAIIERSTWNLVQANPDKFAIFKLPPQTALITGIAINTKRYPTNITDVRLAIVHAINYTDLIEKAFLGQSTRFVGPEAPVWKDFYNLGNFEPYTYNVTLAKEYLAKAHLTDTPTLEFRVPVGFQYALNVAQVVQADLAQIGINVNINVLLSAQFWSVYGSYSSNLENAQNIEHLAILGGADWAPATLTPAEYWNAWVNNESAFGNLAIYSNPTVQKCVDAFTSGISVPSIQAICGDAQAQIYRDAPYVWIGTSGLWYDDGSLVWLKGVVNSFYVEPVWKGQDSIPFFNTVTFVGS